MEYGVWNRDYDLQINGVDHLVAKRKLIHPRRQERDKITHTKNSPPSGPPAVARRRPTAIFVRGATARAEPETFVYSLKARTRRRQGVARRHPASWSLVKRLMSQTSTVGPLGHSTFDLATCRSNCMLRCATSRHAMPFAPCASSRHAMPCAPNALHALFDLCQTYRALFVHACAGVLGARCLLVRRNHFKMVIASRSVRNGARLRRVPPA